MENWYPETVKVGPEGTPSTYNFMKSIYSSDRHFTYAEFGIYEGNTARNICQIFPNATLFLFDYETNIERTRRNLSGFENRIFYFSNTQRYNDSYNWALAKLIRSNGTSGIFDYCFLDGAHTFVVDALCFVLCDRLLRVGGYMDFDDYEWRLRGSSLDPAAVPAIRQQYTDEQIDTRQVELIVETLVRTDVRYKEVVPNKIFQKISA